MVAKTTTKSTATKAAKTTAAKAKATTKVCATRATKATAAKNTIYVDVENVGFRAGDVYQALAAADKALSVAEIAAAANIQTEDVYLGIGWLLKEGKVTAEGTKVTLA